jgi:hypothetical protein
MSLHLRGRFGISSAQEKPRRDDPRRTHHQLMKLTCTATERKTPRVLIAIKRLLWILLFAFTLTSGKAASAPLAGEYQGAWMGRQDPDRGIQGGEASMIISTNGEAFLFLTFIHPINGVPLLHRFDGTIRRNGTIRGAAENGTFRAVRQGKYNDSLRGIWYFPKAHGPVSRLRFYVNYRGPYVPPEE